MAGRQEEKEEGEEGLRIPAERPYPDFPLPYEGEGQGEGG
jgi:hypothetical protein